MSREHAPIEAPPTADVIVVLGARLLADGQPGPALRRRMAAAVALYKAGAAPFLLVSGGGRRSWSEASVMRDVALAEGVPDSAILLEPNSNSTFANAVESAALMRRAGLRSALLVTEGYHLPRARLMFRAAGVRLAGAIAAGSGLPGRPLRLAVGEAVRLPHSLVRALHHRLWRRRAR